jgi:hypothetical protein
MDVPGMMPVDALFRLSVGSFRSVSSAAHQPEAI